MVNDRAAQIEGRRQGEIALFTCPDCCGTLWQVDEQEIVVFRCHVGHVVSAEDLFVKQTGIAENALWTAARTFTDKSVLARQLAIKSRDIRDYELSARFEDQAVDSQIQARATREIVERKR